MDKELSLEQMQSELQAMGERAVAASRELAVMSAADKTRCLEAMAAALEARREEIKAANGLDMKNGAAAGLSAALLDRLRLDDVRIDGMARGLREVAAQEDPVGRVLSRTVRPNGLEIEKISVPLGVIAIIYESRPNVTSDAAGICLKAGNCCILRGGREAFHSNSVIARILNQAACDCGLPDGAVQLLPWTERTAVNLMLKMHQYIDLVIPRGGEGLIRAVMAESTIPVIKHYKGVCHLYIAPDCEIEMAVNLVENAKCQRPSACNALETLLVDRAVAPKFLPPFLERMRQRKVELRGDEAFLAYAPEARAATEEDYYAEYLDYILTVKLVDGLSEAVRHINHYGSKHSDGIVCTSPELADAFFARVDSAALYWNASTRFTDGGEFGMGAEIGISTDKIHARGPMGADELTSYKYLVRGHGQIRV